MYSADAQGLRGEDRYAMLAYYALRQLEDTDKRLLQTLSTMPMPPFIVRDELQKDAPHDLKVDVTPPHLLAQGYRSGTSSG